MRTNKWIPVALAINIILLLLFSMGSQAATLEKDINSYVGEVKLSDTRMSIRLTFDDANIGTLKISRWNKRLGKTKIEESYFASLEADTLTLAGEIFSDIKYLFKSPPPSYIGNKIQRTLGCLFNLLPEYSIFLLR